MKKELVTRELEARGISYKEIELQKGGKTLPGILLELGTLSPVIYPELIEEDEDLVELIDFIVSENEERLAKANEIMDTVKKFTEASEKLRVYLRPQTDDNSVVKRNYLDLEAVLELNFHEATTPVKREFLNTWGVSEDEVWEIAMDNTRSSVKEVFNIGEMVSLSNDELVKGSGALLFPDAFENYAELMCDDLWIIPSSIHEVIIFKKSTVTEQEVIDMIRTTNAEKVADHEILGDHPYVYGRFTNEIYF